MLNFKIISLSALLLTAYCSTFSQKDVKLGIVPKPQSVEITNDELAIDKNIEIVIISPTPDKNMFTAKEIQRVINEQYKFSPEIRLAKSMEAGSKLKQIILQQTDSAKMADKKYPDINGEGYYLTIDKEKLIIKAFKPAGIFYGAVSLIQIMEQHDNNVIPGVKIVDWPDMRFRGISDDISRGQVSTMENFKKIIMNLARYKMNTYMPYLEDMVQLTSYPSIGKERGALSKAEVKELVDFAGKYFIEVIPIFQTLGHYENILSQDEFVKYAEFPGAASLNVSSDTTYIFLENMLKEVFEMFPSKYFHMGADESYDVGLGKSRKLVEMFNKPENPSKSKKKGHKNTKTTKEEANEGIAAVHAQHYKRVYDICRKYGKNVLMYSDIVLQYPKIIQMIPNDIIMIDWHYSPMDDYKSTKTFKDAGFRYMVSPSVWNFYAGFPVNAIALPNITHITQSGISNSSMGMINSCWGDYGSETFRELNYYGYSWSAQCSWNIKGSDLTTFSHDYFSDFFGFDDTRNAKIYQTLSEPFNQVPWHEMWRHPLLPFRDPPAWEGKRNITVKMNWIDLTLPQLIKDIDELKAKAKKNIDHYDLLKYIARLNLYYRYKAETQGLLAKRMEKKDADLTLLMSMIDKNITLLKQLRDDYSKLWLVYYKKDNLNMINDKFNREIAYFKETKESTIKDNLQSPIIKSEWIYMKKNTTDFASAAYFKTEFRLENKADSALLQLMGDTYAKLYINGKYIDQVYARGSLSLGVDYKRFKLLDISKYLKDSINTIEVRCENYNAKDKAGCNIYAEIYHKDKTKVVKTDESWEAKLPESKDWAKATEQKFAKMVIAPDFKTKRTSWIER